MADEGTPGEDEPWLTGIAGKQLPRLIESDAKVIQAIAGPGSGKTTGLKRRVQRLVEGKGIEPNRIFVGTFTRAIARELADELGETIAVSTIHSLALRLLRENPAALGGLSLRFLPQYEEEAMLYDIGLGLPDFGDQRDRRRALTRLQSAWAERRALPDARFHGAVERWLRGNRGMLIGEVVPVATRALQGQDIAQGQFDEVIVDEYQDLTACEQELVEHVWSRRGSMVVLGDDDQSLIYSFRYNHPGGITEFAGRWSEETLDQIAIPDNRRSGSSIVELANVMMAEAGSAKEPMVAQRSEVGDTSLVHWPTADDEIAGLADYIKFRADQAFLVLVPRRYIGHRLQQLIGPEARTAFHQEVLEHPVVQERFAAAFLLADTQDQVALRSWFGFGGFAELAAQRNASAFASLPDDPHSAFELAEAIHMGTVRPSGAGQRNIVDRARMLLELREAAPAEIDGLIDYLFDPELSNHLTIDEERRQWVAGDLLTLREAAHKLVEGGCGSLAEVMTALRYRIATRAPLTEDESGARVRIMTLHSAKGLEADAIIVAGLADQIVPGPRRATEVEDTEYELSSGGFFTWQSLARGWSSWCHGLVQ